MFNYSLVEDFFIRTAEKQKKLLRRDIFFKIKQIYSGITCESVTCPSFEMAGQKLEFWNCVNLQGKSFFGLLLQPSFCHIFFAAATDRPRREKWPKAKFCGKFSEVSLRRWGTLRSLLIIAFFANYYILPTTFKKQYLASLNFANLMTNESFFT